MIGKSIPTFRIWCQKVLPLVYDDSLSYYEVLCKVVDYINDLIEADKVLSDELETLKAELKVVQDWIANYNTEFAKEVIKGALGQMILVGLTDDGYIVFYIPESWSDIRFATTGYDIEIPIEPEYGHLVLRY